MEWFGGFFTAILFFDTTKSVTFIGFSFFDTHFACSGGWNFRHVGFH